MDHFRLPNGCTVTSIYDNLKHLNIMDYFKYNNRIYQTYNLKKTIKKMGLLNNDIKLFTPEIKEEPIEKSDIVLHHFRLPNGCTVTSIYDDLKHLNITDYEKID